MPGPASRRLQGIRHPSRSRRPANTSHFSPLGTQIRFYRGNTSLAAQLLGPRQPCASSQSAMFQLGDPCLELRRSWRLQLTGGESCSLDPTANLLDWRKVPSNNCRLATKCHWEAGVATDLDEKTPCPDQGPRSLMGCRHEIPPEASTGSQKAGSPSAPPLAPAGQSYPCRQILRPHIPSLGSLGWFIG